jgi:integrase
MAGRQAKILHDQQINDLLVFASATRNPQRNKLIVLLSLKAGLRAGEIAKLTWDMVLDPTGEIGSVIELRDCAAKKKSGRLIPMHPGLRTALAAWRRITNCVGPVIRSERGGAMTPVSIVTGSHLPIGLSALKAARRIQAAAPSSLGLPGSFTKQAARCAMFSYWPVTGRFKPRSGTSTAIPTLSASWCR